MLLLAAATIAAMPDWVPARWFSKDAATLRLVETTPINCLLLERANWSKEFVQAATERGIATLGIVENAADVQEARQIGFTGTAVENDFDAGPSAIALSTRSKMKFDSDAKILATRQGIWPGIRGEQETHAAASGAPWIDTNTGFLRFARVSTKASIWIANRVPPGPSPPVARYLAAIGDAGMTGARWVIDIDKDFAARLIRNDAAALKDWQRIVQHVKYYEDHKEWRGLGPHATLALIEDPGTGALLSGGVLDMIATKHTPVRPVPARLLEPPALLRATMTVNVDPESLNAHQKEVLRSFTRSGGTLLSGPPGWKFPSLKPDQITLEKDDLEKLDEIWKELNGLTGRKNLGARLFNVSSMLSNLLESADGTQVVLHLVNYSDYPLENIAAHVLGKFRSATLYRPDAPPKKLEIYEVEEGTGVDIPLVSALATVVLNP
jgi:hypothetical protein